MISKEQIAHDLAVAYASHRLREVAGDREETAQLREYLYGYEHQYIALLEEMSGNKKPS